jgi:hypothetical protein
MRRYYNVNESDVPDLVDGFVKLNAALKEHLDEYHTIGHAFFLMPHFTSQDLTEVWKRKIKPLLDEYFFASPDVGRSFQLSKFWPSMAE